jgi:catechol 2,3-dioxygenase-like lactoylglutathione lyase family enzyme
MTHLPSPGVMQIAMCTANMPATVRRYTKVLGFADAGGDQIWGTWFGKLQQLDSDTACTMWWMVGRQSMVQLELFQHTIPSPRPLPEDWRPSDHGWVRWGCTVPDFDECIERLAASGIDTFTGPEEQGGVRRVCFRDPDIGVIVEILEDGVNVPGGVRPRDFDVGPCILYATVSVPDLEDARRFFVTTLGLEEQDPDTLHDPTMEHLWGLSGSTERTTTVVRGGDVYIEIVCYKNPKGRAKPAGYRLSDQGMMNVAVGYRDPSNLDALLERLADSGTFPTTEMRPGQTGAYLFAPDTTSLEVLALPAGRDDELGFVPRRSRLREPLPFASPDG